MAKKKTVWVECAYWTERAGIVPYLKKGTKVYVDGTPELRQYTTADGKSGASLTLRVASVELLGKGEGVDSGEPPTQPGGEYPTQRTPTQSVNPPKEDNRTTFDDDLPF